MHFHGAGRGGPPAVTDDMKIPGLPHRVPFTPDIMVRQPVADYVNLVHGFLLLEIQEKANNNVLRQHLYWLMSERGFQNQQYMELVMTAMEYFEFLAVMQGIEPNRAASMVAQDLCSITAAQEASNHPGLQQELDQNGLADVDRWLHKYREIGGHVQSFLQYHPAPEVPTMGGGGMPPGGAPANYGGGYQPGGGGYHNPQPGYGGMRNSGAGMPGYAGGPGYGGGMPVMDTRRGAPPPGGGGMPRPNMAMPAGGGRNDVFRDNRGGGSTSHPSASRTTSLQPIKPKQEAPEETMERTRPEPAKPSGPRRVLAVKSGQNVNPIYQAYATLYDPAKGVMYHLIDGKKVVEQLEERPEDMKYEEHETEHFLKSSIRREGEVSRDREKARRAFREVLAEKDVEEYVRRFNADDADNGFSDLDAEAGNDIIAAVSVVEDVITAGSESHAPMALLSYFLDRELPTSMLSERAIRYSYVVSESYQLWDDIAVKYMELQNSSSYVQLADRLRAIADDGEHAALAKILIRMATDHINEIVTIGLAMRLTIDSIVSDIDDLREAIAEDYGPVMLETFDNTVSRVVKQNFGYMPADGLLEDGSSEQTDAIAPVRYGTNVQVPINAEDFPGAAIGDVARVLESRFPELYKAIEHTLDNAHPQARHVKFVTLDGEEVKLHRSLIADSLLISK